MSANVIQHPTPRRKRGRARSWTLRHFVLLGVVITGIIAASWLAPDMAPQPVLHTPNQRVAAPPLPSITPDAAIVEIAADLAGPQPAPVRRRAVQDAGIPLNAAVTQPDEYEILSAAELDAISQARH
ncbi:MAG: hypothetical protein KF779_14025 [Hyphomonadaceae bacterium]|nr:hypothetical protein [Hyphomonadaceae bacterium]